MGWKVKKVNTELKPNEEQDMILTLQPEKRAAIHGIVKLPNCKPAVNALVKLFKKTCNDPWEIKPVTFMYTDECGEFLFGVDSGVQYVIKVSYYVPEKCENDCDSECCGEDED